MNHGNVALILHAHHPYVRAAGRSYTGEQSLHELTATSLIPTLATLRDVQEQGMQPKVALAWSPLLLEQLADPVVQKHFGFWLDDWRTRLDQIAARCESQGHDERAYLARFYREWAESVAHSFDVRFNRNLITPLRQLCEEGVIEPLSSTASFAPLNQFARAETLRAQVELGALAVARWFGRQPHGFWPPALDYRVDASELLVAAGAQYVVLEPPADNRHPPAPGWLLPHRLALLTRDAGIAPYIDDPALAYSGDPLYRTDQRDADGIAWSRNGLIEDGEPYDPFDAFQRAREHAEHFADVLAARAASGQLLAVTLDTGLLGMRWFEGPTWLGGLISTIATHANLALVLPGSHLRASRPQPMIPQRTTARHTPGEARFSLVRALHGAETRLATLARHHAEADGERERTLQQAARELVLAHSGDTPQRTTHHLSRCSQLCDIAERPAFTDTDLTTLETLEEEDNPFAYLNYRMWG